MLRKQKGFSFVEIGIVLTIVALALMVLVPKAQNYLLNGKITAMQETLDEIRKGMVDCRARFNSYANCTWQRLTDEGFISAKTAGAAAGGNPWGGAYTVTPGGQSFTITAGGVQAEACQRGATTFSNMGTGITGSCAGSSLTITYAN